MASLISFSGIASGIDSSSLIQATLDAERKARIKPLQEKISKIEDTNSSFDELKSLLGKLKTASDQFRSLNGGGLAKQATSADETKVTAKASNSAQTGTYSLSVTQLARGGVLSLNDRFSTTSSSINSSINDAASGSARTVTVTVGTGANQESVAVQLTSTTTPEEFVTSFNASSSKGSASLVNVGTVASPSYAIVISSKGEGSENGTLGISVGGEITSAGSGAFVSSALNQAQDAEFSLSGVGGVITRATNSVADVIPGVTLNLKSTGSTSVNVSGDTSGSTDSVQQFVDSYNEIVKYISEKNVISRDESSSEVKNVFGSLANTSLDDSLLSSLRSVLSGASNGGEVGSLANLGITTNRDGTLSLDSDKFQSSLASDPSAVGDLLQNVGDTLGAVDGTIAQYTRFGGLIDSESNSGKSLVIDMNKRIAGIEKNISLQEETLTQQFSRLESTIGKLTSQQNALTGLLR